MGKAFGVSVPREAPSSWESADPGARLTAWLLVPPTGVRGALPVLAAHSSRQLGSEATGFSQAGLFSPLPSQESVRRSLVWEHLSSRSTRTAIRRLPSFQELSRPLPINLPSPVPGKRPGSKSRWKLSGFLAKASTLTPTCLTRRVPPAGWLVLPPAGGRARWSTGGSHPIPSSLSMFLSSA